MARKPHIKYERLVERYEKHLAAAMKIESQILALLEPISSDDGNDNRRDSRGHTGWLPLDFCPTLDSEREAHEPDND